MFTLDQIADMLAIKVATLEVGYVWFDGRSGGLPSRDEIIARNIAPPDAPPEWRVAENDFIRWLKKKGFRFHDRGFASR